MVNPLLLNKAERKVYYEVLKEEKEKIKIQKEIDRMEEITLAAKDKARNPFSEKFRKAVAETLGNLRKIKISQDLLGDKDGKKQI